MQIETFSQFYLAVAWDQHPEALPEESRMHPDPAVAAVSTPSVPLLLSQLLYSEPLHVFVRYFILN